MQELKNNNNHPTQHKTQVSYFPQKTSRTLKYFHQLYPKQNLKSNIHFAQRLKDNIIFTKI
jgi:hypothetical protein